MFKNIGIIISTKGNSSNLQRTINSIFKQSRLPKEIILVSNQKIKKISVNKLIKIKIYYSKIKNQVLQRNIGINKLSKNIDILLQLDDRVILQKDCIFELLKSWNNTKKNVVGIGINQINLINNFGFFNKFSKIMGLEGKVFSVGLNFDYSNLKKDLEVMWIKGGLSSWAIERNFRIKNRKFPKWSWSVNEDVDYCLGKNKNEKIMVCYKAKANIVNKYNNNYYENFNRGILLTISKKLIIRKHFNNSLLSFLGNIILVIFGIFKSVLTFNLSNFFFSLGRFVGLFKKETEF
tara:strand:- start:4566 stop:5441 length:876 start_codon:yes stop_codon:yes gene_type:complete